MYADGETVRAARQRYFEANGFSDASYSDRWVKIKIGPLPVAFPNTATRRRAIPLHDLHHVATGYDTSFVGEAEISAFEIGGGCTNHWAAWVLNLSGLGYGLGLAPRRTYRAFVRGRHAQNLYRGGWRDELLDETVGELRARMQLTAEPVKATSRDRLAFAAWAVLLALYGIPAGLVFGLLTARRSQIAHA
jgi:hypothetical protein